MSRPSPAAAAFCLALLTLPLTGGCLAVSAARAAGDVAEGAVNATGAVAGAIIPGGDDDEDEQRD
ncbi:MAG: hypothetical protein AAF253_02820 [Pseudomonadota bacterium]